MAAYIPQGVEGEHFGRDAIRGLELWADGAGALLALGSGSSEPDAVRSWYQQAAARADVLVAPYGSSLTRPAFEAAEAVGVPCVAPSAGDKSLWGEGRRWCVGLLEPSTELFVGVLRLAAAAGPGDVALLQRNDPYSTATMAGAAAAAASFGLGPVVRRRFVTASERSAAVRATRERIVLGIGYQPGTSGDGFLDDAVALAQQLGPSNLQGPAGPRVLALGVAAAAPDFGGVVGSAAEGVVGVTGWRPYLETPGNDAFVAAYRGRWKTEPDAHAAQGFAAGEVVEQGACASTEMTAEGLREALFTLDTHTVFGRYRVAATGLQIGHEPALVQWQGGKLVILDPQRPQQLAPWTPWTATVHRSTLASRPPRTLKESA